MSPSVELEPTGPDRFCPDCGRLLFNLSEGGGFDLAGKAMIESRFELRVDSETMLPVDDETPLLVIEAICLRRRCRFARWRRDKLQAPERARTSR
jgi:hypothetical protein